MHEIAGAISYYVLNGCGFIPVAFMSVQWEFYRQFAITKLQSFFQGS
jgi:hypothetical protein